MPRIVVVDDSKLMRNLIQKVLEQEGHQVEAWEDVSASDIEGRIKASTPDVIVTDYMMPGCNGLTVARLARKSRPGLPVVVVTSSHDPAVLEALQKQDVSAILHKPLKERELLDAVAKVAS